VVTGGARGIGRAIAQRLLAEGTPVAVLDRDGDACAALAVSLGPAVRVNGVQPGWINTDPDYEPDAGDHVQHPAGRVGRPEDVAGLVTWLLGPETGFITGQQFVADGGMTRRMLYAN